MHENMLAVEALERADGGHHPAARVGAVAGALGVDMAGVEAIGAVVAVMSAAGQRADKAMAVAAGETVVNWPAPLIATSGAIAAVRALGRLGAASLA